MSTVGFVGLGAMGSRIAGRLLDLGNEVYGTNRTKSRAQPLIERGLQWRDTPREVALVATWWSAWSPMIRRSMRSPRGPTGSSPGWPPGRSMST